MNPQPPQKPSRSVPRGNVERLLAGLDEPHAVDGDVELLVEQVQPAAPPQLGQASSGASDPRPCAVRDVERAHRISGDGTGTMKRPPRARYSACWRMTSSR